MNKRWLRLIATLAAPVAFAQSGPTAPPVFDVASIRACQNGGSSAKNSPGRLAVSCFSLRKLIQDAYEIFATGQVDPRNPSFPTMPIEGAPAWLDSESYTIEAVTNAPASVPMMRGPMMRALLEDRFHLSLHRETREVPVYALTQSKAGAKLTPSQPGSCVPITAGEFLTPRKFAPGDPPYCAATPPHRQGDLFIWNVRGIDLDLFCSLIHIDRPVVNRTGLTGLFDIDLKWESENPADGGPGGSLMEAIRAQLGLHLDPATGPREFLVIDHIERPTGN
ncbi:MAG TPA: TIGR03435 family protein [Bryobacteraceae bacterium]|nr:TIGR03435 family protein [Bryobacteraceae bacterium]